MAKEKDKGYHLDLSRYIVCRSNCPPRILESLAMNGFAKRVEVVDCGKKRFKKLRLILTDDSIVESECRFEEEIASSLRIIASYMGLLRLKKVYEKTSTVEGVKGKQNR